MPKKTVSSWEKKRAKKEAPAKKTEEWAEREKDNRRGEVKGAKKKKEKKEDEEGKMHSLHQTYSKERRQTSWDEAPIIIGELRETATVGAEWPKGAKSALQQ